MARGGYREGAGRRGRGFELVARAFRLRKEDAEFLKETAEEVGISQAEVIHVIIEQYKKDCETGC